MLQVLFVTTASNRTASPKMKALIKFPLFGMVTTVVLWMTRLPVD